MRTLGAIRVGGRVCLSYGINRVKQRFELGRRVARGLHQRKRGDTRLETAQAQTGLHRCRQSPTA